MTEVVEAAEFRSAVRGMWEAVLKKQVSDNADFFLLGGDSLAAMSVSSRLEEVFGIKPKLRVLFEHPRFGDYVHAISQAAREGS
ncbi:acyl carrier protein [Actinomadura macra]|uniref:acyl carrier protein n=1 Tax=Actinomadura macra TaxID=46164 RepID=UPI0008312D16|nr:acyl carrier protein [Actinomadura macra]